MLWSERWGRGPGGLIERQKEGDGGSRVGMKGERDGERDGEKFGKGAEKAESGRWREGGRERGIEGEVERRGMGAGGGRERREFYLIREDASEVMASDFAEAAHRLRAAGRDGQGCPEDDLVRSRGGEDTERGGQMP
jgi:hypothetical protein